MMADHEKDVLARALEPFALTLNVWALRSETPVMTGRMMVAVAVTVEMGSAKARILYRTILRCHKPCVYGGTIERSVFWTDEPAYDHQAD